MDFPQSYGVFYSRFGSFNPVLNGCRMVENSAWSQDEPAEAGGGALSLLNSTAPIESLIIEGNRAAGEYSGGGGIYLADGWPVFRSCVLRNNETTGNGGGVAVGGGDPTEGIFNNCAICDNTAAGDGGGVSVDASSGLARLLHCTVTYNHSTSNAISSAGTGIAYVDNSIVWFNRAASGPSGIAPSSRPSTQGSKLEVNPSGEGNGNVSTPPGPKFAWDHYHLLGQPADLGGAIVTLVGQLAVSNTATPTDIDGEPRSRTATTSERGCDEFTDSNTDGIPDWYAQIIADMSASDSITNDFVTLSTSNMGSIRLWGSSGPTIAEAFNVGLDPTAAPDKVDTDKDGVTDVEEERLGLNRLFWSTDYNGRCDSEAAGLGAVRDFDGDQVMDIDDAVPNNEVLRFRRSPEMRYVAIDLGPGIPLAINARGDVLIRNTGGEDEDLRIWIASTRSPIIIEPGENYSAELVDFDDSGRVLMDMTYWDGDKDDGMAIFTPPPVDQPNNNGSTLPAADDAILLDNAGGVLLAHNYGGGPNITLNLATNRVGWMVEETRPGAGNWTVQFLQPGLDPTTVTEPAQDGVASANWINFMDGTGWNLGPIASSQERGVFVWDAVTPAWKKVPDSHYVDGLESGSLRKFNNQGIGLYVDTGALIYRNNTFIDLNELVSIEDSIEDAVDINNEGLIAALAEDAVDGTDQVKLLIPVDIVPDFNRDGNITAADSGKITESEPYRFWVNDDDDTAESDVADDSSTPTPDSADNVVKSMRDLIDFFPLFLDIKQLIAVLSPDEYDYVLSQADSAVNVIPTDLEADSDSYASVGSYLRDESAAGVFVSTQGPADSPYMVKNRVTQVPAAGKKLEPQWLKDGLLEGKRRVLLVEGKQSTIEALTLRVFKINTTQQLAKIEFPLSLKLAKTMYRWLNLRAEVDGQELAGGGSNMAEPTNWPDRLTNGKVFAFVHGYNVNEKNARTWGNEVMKRLFWAGSRAKFVMVTWRGNQGQLFPDLEHHGPTADYWVNATNAFKTAPHLKQQLSLPGNKLYIAGHSLGNMVVSSAIKDQNLSVERYYMVNAAVPAEAYDPSTLNDAMMGHPEWRNGVADKSLWSPNFYKLFTQGDARNQLTWKGRFSGLQKVYQLYSTGEDALETNALSNGAEPTLTGDVMNSRQAWVSQEMSKGRLAKVVGQILGGVQSHSLWNSANGGWGRNAYWTGNTQPTTTGDKIANPLFDPFTTFNSASIHGPQGATVASDYLFRCKLLGEEIPALSWPAGSTPVPAFSKKRDLMTLRKGWPADRMAALYELRDRWLHSDMKDVSYLYVHPFYEELVKNGVLK